MEVRNLFNNLILYRHILAQHLKSKMSYPLDFILGMIGMLLSQLIGIIFLGFVFMHIPQIKGWSFNELIFIYGFSLFPKSIDSFFSANLSVLTNSAIISGGLDKYYLRPMSIMFQLITDVFHSDALGEFVMGIVLFSLAYSLLGLDFNIYQWILFILLIAFSAILLFSLKVIFTSLAFWFKRTSFLLNFIYSLSDYSKYPTSFFPAIIETLLTFIIPLSFAAFIPAAGLLERISPVKYIVLLPLIAIIISVIAIIIWRLGIKRYESSGT